MASKIIVLGNVAGKLESAFTKLSALHAKNNFSIAVVVGNLVGTNEEINDLLEGRISIPLPTYFTMGSIALPEKAIAKLAQDKDLCPNLHYLGKRSTTKTSEGIKIVALGGAADGTKEGLSTEPYEPSHSVGDAKALFGANSADILVTYEWPASITRWSRRPLPDGSILPSGHEHIAQLCAALKPRYHFSVSPEVFYERDPFFHFAKHETVDADPVTRFISLAAWGNEVKQKSIYAFTLQPASAAPAAPPAGATRSPFVQEKRKRDPSEPEPYSRFGGEHGDRRIKRGRRDRGPPPGPNDCFFCLANVKLATHLVTSIAEDAYLATAKGPLTTSETFKDSGIDFPCNILIVPLSHSATLAGVPVHEDTEAPQKSFAEMTRYKSALYSMVASKSANRLGAVTYEISRSRGIHTHWQFIPFPAAQIEQGIVEAGFRVEAENMKYGDFEAKDPGLGEGSGDFFRVWLWIPAKDGENEGTEKCMTLSMSDHVRFDLQFGRRVLGKLLGLEKRVDWRDCTQTEEEENRDVETFKAAFEKFDFST